MSESQPSSGPWGRRPFLKTTTAALGAAAIQPATLWSVDPRAAKMIGIQIPAVSFLDEGVEGVLDRVQEHGAVNTVFPAVFTCASSLAGRQKRGHPFPDHGKAEYDDLKGGNFATPHPQYYTRTTLKHTKAPEYGSYDVLEALLPKARARGVKVYANFEGRPCEGIPGFGALAEVNMRGEQADTLCNLNPDRRGFLTGLTEDLCRSYEIDGLLFGLEHQGPLNNLIKSCYRNRTAADTTCFCELHLAEGRRRGIDVVRVRQGYERLGRFVDQALAAQRPNDGYFVEFWRILLDYPEILSWEKLWTGTKHQIYVDIYETAKQCRPSVAVGFHIWHNNSFSPFFRAEQDYAAFASHADFIKVVAYNNCGGPRYADYIRYAGSTIFRDVPAADLYRLHNHILGYDEKPLEEIPSAGLSADYVARETRRALGAVEQRCRIYTGIDVDIPVVREGARYENEKTSSAEDVYRATRAALEAGADGVLYCRKYSEMRLSVLAGGGRAVRELRL